MVLIPTPIAACLRMFLFTIFFLHCFLFIFITGCCFCLSIKICSCLRLVFGSSLSILLPIRVQQIKWRTEKVYSFDWNLRGDRLEVLPPLRARWKVPKRLPAPSLMKSRSFRLQSISSFTLGLLRCLGQWAKKAVGAKCSCTLEKISNYILGAH